MRLHTAVIGANFGDEGKGQMVDYFASTGKFQRVVRFNGGSQAGHTVVTPDGKRHVFSQIGAGAFCGIPTHLSRFMYINPVYLMRELYIFKKLTGMSVKLSIDPRAQLIFESDVRAQQFVEKNRVVPHGSTGHGLFNAVQRHLSGPNASVSAIQFKDIGCYDLPFLVNKIDSYYGNNQSVNWFDELNDSLLEVFFSNEHSISFDFDEDVVNRYDCIFEGAQGLLLDQNSGFFPHVTPSNTGLTNVVSLLSFSEAFSYSLSPVYVSRSFLTRHGNGPMYREKYDSIYNYDLGQRVEDFHDETNVHNQWQGSMRYGKINVEQLSLAINRDYFLAAQQMGNTAMLDNYKVALTWANMTSQQQIIEQIKSELPVRFLSYSPTRGSVIDVSNE